MRRVRIICGFISMVIATNLFGGTDGTIKGTVIDRTTKQPLAGVNILLIETTLGASSDIDGNFIISNVPLGAYRAKFMFIGYASKIKTDIIVKPGRDAYIDIELGESAVEGETIMVTASYFQKDETSPVSAVNFSREEIRRTPGVGGDISRIMSTLPGVSQQTDQFNDLIVRGGSPVENGYYLDNIPIPNINHFPVLGSAGGAMGIINVDFINDVNFYAGGFSSAYGNKLSSIMDISYREGNRESIDLQLDLNMAGFGGQADGPLPGKKGSWLISGKRSYLDLIQDAIGTTGETPRYGDIQGKIDYDINPENKITALYIYAPSSRFDDRDHAQETGRFEFTKNWEALQNTAGVNWRRLWSEKSYSNTSFSFSQITTESEYHFISKDLISRISSVSEAGFTLRNTNFYKFDKRHKIEFGIESKYLLADYNYFYAADTNYAGLPTEELRVKQDLKSPQINAFANFIWQPLEQFTTTLGLRSDYYKINQSLNISPRLAISYRVNSRLSLNASTGIFYQSLPLFLVSQNKLNQNLDNLKSTHYVAGIDYLLTADTKLTLEFYNKEFQDFPLSSAFPQFFILDQGTNYGAYNNYGKLESSGESYARGVDLLIQKKLAVNFYGTLSASWFRSRYKDFNGVWRDRIFDNKLLLQVIGGYKPNKNWETSIRWSYAGGAPYTPFDIEKSRELNMGIYDLGKINAERMPDYHSLNLRVDRRFHFQNSSVVAYMSIWNLYNRKNDAIYVWNRVKKEVRTLYQWRLLPIIGIEYEL